MSASTTQPLHVLRGILRQLKKSSPPASQSSSSNEPNLRQYIISQYRASTTLPIEKAAKLRVMALDFYKLQTDLSERARLHELDAGADVKLTPKELSRRAAARAGLQLPNLDQGS